MSDPPARSRPAPCSDGPFLISPSASAARVGSARATVISAELKGEMGGALHALALQTGVPE